MGSYNSCLLFLLTVIACRPSFPPYLAALNPTDQVFDFEELEYHYLVANRIEDPLCKDDDDDDDDDCDEKGDHDRNNSNDESMMMMDPYNTSPQKSSNIDNPFLKALMTARRNAGISNNLNF